MDRRRPQAALTYYVGDDIAVVAQGVARVLSKDDRGLAKLDGQVREQHGQSTTSRGKGDEGVFVVVTPTKLVTYTSSKA